MQHNLYVDIPKSYNLITAELVLVVLIISIAVSLAIPIYSQAVLRAKASEILMLFGGLKLEAMEYYAQYGRWPTNLHSLKDAVDYNSNTTDNYRYKQGAISGNLTVTGESLTIRPMLLNSQAYVVAWTCGYALPPPGFTVYGPNSTNMPPMQLAHICRN